MQHLPVKRFKHDILWEIEAVFRCAARIDYPKLCLIEKLFIM